MKPSQVIAYLDTSGGLDLDARRPWPGRRQADEVIRPLDARALLGASSAPGLWDVAALAPTVLAPLADAAAADPRPVRWDVDAWYRPAHLAAYDMGIVVRERAVVDLATDLAAYAAGAGVQLPPTDDVCSPAAAHGVHRAVPAPAVPPPRGDARPAHAGGRAEAALRHLLPRGVRPRRRHRRAARGGARERVRAPHALAPRALRRHRRTTCAAPSSTSCARGGRTTSPATGSPATTSRPSRGTRGSASCTRA